MWNEDIPSVGNVSADRIRNAVESARLAFFADMAASFPEVTTGDMAPGEETDFEFASNKIVVRWLLNNLSTTVDVVSDFTGIGWDPVIGRWVYLDDGRALSFDEVESRGLDGTLRTLPDVAPFYRPSPE